MFAFLLPFLPSIAALKLYALGAGLVALLAIAGWHQMTTSWTTWRDNRAGEAAVHAALDHTQEIARRQAQLATQRAAAADAAQTNAETLQGMLADAHLKTLSAADIARCVTPLDRVRLLRAAVGGTHRKGGTTTAAAR